MTNTLFLSMGSNIEPKVDYLKKAKYLLDKKFTFIAESSIYQTNPLLDRDQPHFYNQVLFYQTTINDPFLILKIVNEIERKIGRVKDITRPKGPRVIDIDIIFYNDLKIESDLLTIPHRSFCERNFVLIPLCEIIDDIQKNDKIVNEKGEFKKIMEIYKIRDFIKINSEQKVEKLF